MHHFGQKILTEQYSSTGQLKRVTQRIDFWDNGFQNVNQDVYTVNRGDSLQTHCFFNTSGKDTKVDFGVATGEEMCMSFVFYYPIQYKGVNAKGDQEPWSMCGLKTQNLGDGDQQITLCGSVAQTGNGFLMVPPDKVSGNMLNGGANGGQVDRGTAGWADPFNFGAANKAVKASQQKTACTPATPTPSKTSPTPAPAAVKTVTTIKQEVTFSNIASAADYKGAVKTTYELAYGKANGLTVTGATGTIAYKPGAAVSSSAARRGAKVTFVATVQPSFKGTRPTTATTASAASIATAMTEVITKNKVQGVVAPTTSQMTVAKAKVESKTVASSASPSASFGLLSLAAVATVAVGLLD
jgi:hypothetical protein